MIFGRHDLIQDAPISRVNVLMCRNTLMYFNNEAQARILARFHFALGHSGVLFLGRSEMLLTHGHLFAPLELKRRVFRKVTTDNWRERMAVMTRANGEETFDAADHHNILPAAFDVSPHAQFVIDSNGLLALVNDRARALFGLAPTDMSKPIQDLELSYRPVELRSLISQTLDQRRPVTLREALWEAVGHEAKYLDVHVVPLYEQGGRPIGVSVSFVDVIAGPGSAGAAEPFQARPRDGIRRTAVDQRRARNDERRTAVHGRGAGDDERRAAVDERRARDDERGTAVHQRRAADHRRGAAPAQRRPQSHERVSSVGPERRPQRGRRASTARCG